MTNYTFVTIWKFKAPLDAVWDAIYHTRRWPEWWTGVLSVEELQKGDENDIGTIRRYTWKSRLPYKLVFNMRSTRIEPMTFMEGIAFGELDGVGQWTFTHESGITTARYDWNVKTTKAWMNFLAPIARPFFKWNHDVVMRWGGEGLARLLGVELIEGG